MQLTGWKDKRKIMQSYDVTAEMYDERYAEEQKRKYKKALENVNVTGKVSFGCWLRFRTCSSKKLQLKQVWLLVLMFHVNCCLKPKSRAGFFKCFSFAG